MIIVTSSLMKDMNSKTDLYRANAIRVLCRITDGGLLGQIERYLKQAVVDKNPVVASAALVSGSHLFQVRCEATETRMLWYKQEDWGIVGQFALCVKQKWGTGSLSRPLLSFLTLLAGIWCLPSRLLIDSWCTDSSYLLGD